MRPLCVVLLRAVACGGVGARRSDADTDADAGASDASYSPCTDGYILCKGNCLLPFEDEKNCGGCGLECIPGAVCSSGECGCPDGTIECDGACVPSNNEHCGTCETKCGPTFTCINDGCRCAAGLTKCGNACFNTAIEVHHCGSCGNDCGNGQFTGCSGGMCCSLPALGVCNATADCCLGAICDGKTKRCCVANGGDCKE